MPESLRGDNKGHNDGLLAAATAFQSASVPGASQATLTSAAITYFRAARTSAIANGCSPSVFTQALISLGTGGA